jgi:hypothetical protein
MKELSKFFDLKQASLFLISLPYLTFNYENIIHSPFYSFTKLILILACILFLDVVIKWILLKLNKKINNTISLLIIFISIVFFYGLYLIIFIQAAFLDHFHLLIRGRTMIELSVVFFILLIIILKKKRLDYKYLNVFLILFSAITLLTSITNAKSKTKENFKGGFVSIPVNKKSIKPIILIISDEYTSPSDLYKVYKDSSVYQFSNELASKGWITKDIFYSYETSTIHSLSSLFNFNLSKNKQYGKEELVNIGATRLAHASIADSLEKKQVGIINFGIFHIGKHPYLNRLYLYPTSFIEDILMRTVYYTALANTGNLNKSGLANLYYPMEAHNKYIFNHLVDTLNTLTNTKTFIYTHLFMPHSPMQYMPDFSIRKEKNLKNYKDYWNFTNQKLNILLTELIKDKRYRIIITGDHGYRSDKRIDPNYTFSAFYGFNQESIDKINSVQDLGSLINGGF